MNSAVVDRHEEEVVFEDVNRTSPPSHTAVARGGGEFGVEEGVHGGYTR